MGNIYILTDKDDAGQKGQESLIDLIGWDRALLLAPISGKDPAEDFEAGVTRELFAESLEKAIPALDTLVKTIDAATKKTDVKAVEEALKKAVPVAVTLSPVRESVFIEQVKKAAKPIVKSTVISKMVEDARKAAKPAVNENGAHGREPAGQQDGADEPSNYFQSNNESAVHGNMMRHQGENIRRIVAGGNVAITKIITKDDGEEPELEMEMEARLADGRVSAFRVPADVSNEPAQVAKLIKKAVGPLLTIEAKEGPYLIPAIEALSRGKMVEVTEIARSGWVKIGERWVFVTPGGIVGELPEGYLVALPKGYERYRVADDGNEAYTMGLEGIINGILKAFEPHITYPALAFALTPVAARWLPSQRFAMHFSGETGTLKTAFAQVCNSFYGDFVHTPPVASWASTPNSLEQMGFWVPDMIGVVDDFKPRVVKPWDFVDVIQRYADRNDRMRLSRDIQLRRRQAMRWWMLSTGEDLPTGESSVLARMISLRFPRRPEGVSYNADLAKAQRLAKNFPTVTARWAAWLAEKDGAVGFDAMITLHHQEIAGHLQRVAPGTPNVNRIAKNLAILWAVWEVWWEFVADSTAKDPEEHTAIFLRRDDFHDIAMSLAASMAGHVKDEKPTEVFIKTMQEGLDGSRFKLLHKTECHEDLKSTTAGWFDDDGVYLLPAMFNEVARWLRESGQQVGFSKNELFRLLSEEGKLIRTPTSIAEKRWDVMVWVGQDGRKDQTKPWNVRRSKRVLRLAPGVLRPPVAGDGSELDE